MKFPFPWLLAALSLAANALNAAAAATDDGWAIPLPSTRLAYHWALGEHRRALELDLDRGARLVFGDTRMRMTITHSSPALYAKLLESLRSKTPGSYPLLARDPATGQEVRLNQVTELSLSTDAAGSVWIRGKALIRVQKTGVAPKSQTRQLAIEFRPAIQNGMMKWLPRSLTITDLSAALEKKLLASLSPIEIPIPPCLQDQDPKLERVSLPARANALEVTVSLRKMSLTEIARCIAEVSASNE